MTVSGLYPQDAQVCGRRLIHRDELDRSLDRDPFAYANQTGRNRLEARFQAYVSTLPRNTMGAIDPALLVPRACPLCGSWESARRFVKYDFPIHRCARCGFSFANPMLNAALTAVLETGDLAADHLTFITQDVYRRCTALRFEYELQQALAYHHGTPKTLLEIGSSIGTGLEVAKAYGLQPIGVEPSPVAAQLAQAAGHGVIVDIFRASHFPVQRFDLIMSMDVLEHVPDPVDFLAQARSILSPDGVLLLQVPNAGALISLLEGKANQIYNGLIHLNYFDGPSLDAMAQKAGLRPLHTTTILSELGKLARWPEAEVRLALRHAYPAIAADYRLHQDWINDHGLGYKVLGLYGYET